MNPSSRLERYASLFDADPPTDDASRQWAVDTALLETLQFVAVSEAFADDLLFTYDREWSSCPHLSLPAGKLPP